MEITTPFFCKNHIIVLIFLWFKDLFQGQNLRLGVFTNKFYYLTDSLVCTQIWYDYEPFSKEAI